jgi:hypothetical protein
MTNTINGASGQDFQAILDTMHKSNGLAVACGNGAAIHPGPKNAIGGLSKTTLIEPYEPKSADQQIAELKAKIAELEVEKARLDHIEENWFTQSHGWIEFWNKDWTRQAGTLREAIDAEIKTEKDTCNHD